jgi:hypothetical protein
VSPHASTASETPSPSASPPDRGDGTLVDVVDAVTVDDVVGTAELLVVTLVDVEVAGGAVEELELLVGVAADVVVELELVVDVAGATVDELELVEVVLVVWLVLVLLVDVVEVLVVDVTDVLVTVVVVTVDRQDADETLVPMRALTVLPKTRSMFARPPAFRWQ